MVQKMYFKEVDGTWSMCAHAIANKDEAPWLVEGCPVPHPVPECLEAHLRIASKRLDALLAQPPPKLVLRFTTAFQ